MPLQSFKVMASVARIDHQDRSDDQGSGGAGSANVFGVGATYAYSKRTDLYLAASKIVNGADVGFVIGDMSNTGLYTSGNVPAGFNPWSAQAGIRHKF